MAVIVATYIARYAEATGRNGGQALAAIFILGQLLKRTLGGQTGDTLGAAIELGEPIFLLACYEPIITDETSGGITRYTLYLVTFCAGRAEAMARAQQHIDGLLKPPRCPAALEALAVQPAGNAGLNGTPQVGERRCW